MESDVLESLVALLMSILGAFVMLMLGALVEVVTSMFIVMLKLAVVGLVGGLVVVVLWLLSISDLALGTLNFFVSWLVGFSFMSSRVSTKEKISIVILGKHTFDSIDFSSVLFILPSIHFKNITLNHYPFSS